LISADAAIAAGPKPETTIPPTAVLASVTIGATLPDAGESSAGYADIRKRAAWVITYTYLKPVDARAGAPIGESPTPIVKTHVNVIVDAQTGEFLWGFYTD
jgi:hypothetical protein